MKKIKYLLAFVSVAQAALRYYGKYVDWLNRHLTRHRSTRRMLYRLLPHGLQFKSPLSVSHLLRACQREELLTAGHNPECQDE